MILSEALHKYNQEESIMDMQKAGSQIATLRKGRRLTQNDLGERLGVSFQAVSKWERGVSHS